MWITWQFLNNADTKQKNSHQFCEEKKAFHWKGFSKNVQFEIRRGRLTEALKTHLHRLSLNLR